MRFGYDDPVLILMAGRVNAWAYARNVPGTWTCSICRGSFTGDSKRLCLTTSANGTIIDTVPEAVYEHGRKHVADIGDELYYAVLAALLADNRELAEEIYRRSLLDPLVEERS